MNLSIRMLGLAFALLIATPASVNAQAVAQDSAAADQVREYRLEPTDKVSISIYPEKSLSADTRVNTDGTIFLPPLGFIKAQGMTTLELTRDIQSRLQACCLQKPLVGVQIMEAASQQITVTGAVKAPNTYSLKGRTTLVQAVAMAGGADMDLADLKRVGIIRQVNGQRAGRMVNLKAVMDGKADDPEVFGGDQIIVDTSGSKSAWRNVLKALPLTSVFTLF